MKGKLVLALAAGILVFSLLFSGCAPTSTPTQSPAQPAAPVSAPRAEYKIQFLAGRPDSAEYATTHGLADLINKNSAWLRATVIETSGLAANYELVVKKPETKPISIICGSASTYSFLTKSKEEGGTGWDWTPYTDVRFIARLNTQVHSWATSDKNIKTMTDFKGKRVFEGPMTGTRWLSDAMIFKEAGVYDSIKFSHGGFGEGSIALGDGLVDVAIQNGISPVIPNDFSPDATMRQLTAGKQIYFANFDKAAFDSAIKKYGISESYFTISKPGLLGPNQTEPVVVKYDASLLVADKSMPDDVIAEFLKIFTANLDKLGDYHVTGKWITKQTIGISGYAKEDGYHPAALKFFKGNAITVAVNPPN